MTSIMLSAKDGNASRKIDILAAFEDATTNREIVVCRAMSCKVPFTLKNGTKWSRTKIKLMQRFTSSALTSMSLTLR